MKKWLFAILLIPSVSLADEIKIPDFSQGMHTYPSANKIPDTAVSYMQNFLTDIEPMAQERLGFVKRDTTILGGTKPVYGSWSFTDSSGNEWSINYSSRTYYKNTIGQTPTAFGPIATVDTIPDAAKNLGFICFVNGTDSMWCFNGTSTGTVSGAPLGKRIVSWRTRFAIGNITGSQSTIRFSADGSTSNWTLGGLATDPFSVQIGGANDGEYIRCLKGSYQDSMIVGRKNDLWAIDGFDQSDLTIRNISSQVGCIEPRTMEEVDGELVFVSARGLEAMNGRQIRLISEPIRDIMDIITKNTSNQRTNTQTSQSDWSAGSNDNSVFIDTNTSAGNVQLTFPDYFNSFRDGSSSTKNVWTSTCAQTATSNCPNGSVEVVSGELNINISQNSSPNSAMVNIVTSNRMRDFRPGTSYYITVSTFPFDYIGGSPGVTNFAVTLSTYITRKPSSGSYDIPHYMPGSPSLSQAFTFTFASTRTGVFFLDGVCNSNDGCTYDSSGSGTPFSCPATIEMYLSTTSYIVTINGTKVTNGTHAWTPNTRLNHIWMGLQHANTDGVIKIGDFSIVPQTATYTSQLITIGNQITSWGPQTISDSKSSATVTYQFGSTSTANLSSITNYQTATNGYIPTVSTNSYAAFKAVFTSSITMGYATLGEYVTSWTEGGVVPSPVSTVYDRRYWLSYTTSTASSPYLDSILVWQRNKSFTLFKGIFAGSFYLWRDYLYFGNSNSTGYVYKYDVGNNDDGSDIVSIITTKSYDFGQFSRDKEFSKSYISYLGGTDQSGSFSLSYNLNRYGTSYSLGTASLSEEQGQNLAKFWFPMNQLNRGREIQFTLLKYGTGSRLKLYDFSTQYETKEEK